MKEIQLSKGMVALVSDEDYEYLSQWKWSVSQEGRGTKWYAIRWSQKHEQGNGKRFKIRMHRVVAERKAFSETNILMDRSHLVVDHVNSNSLDNTRENLEYVTQEENMDRVKGWKGSRSWEEKKEKQTEECFL